MDRASMLIGREAESRLVNDFQDTVPNHLMFCACDASDDVPSAVSSKGGSVKPAHWGLSPDLDPHATEVALPTLRMVGIGDLRQVESHVTHQMAGATRHIVRFRNGGTVRFAYGSDAAVIELSGERISVRIGVQGDVLITALPTRATKGGA